MDKQFGWKGRWEGALREQHKLLFDYVAKSLKPIYAEYVDCPVCGSSNSMLWFEKDWFRHVRCQDCSMVYINPRMNQAATHSFYNSNVNAIYNETKFDEVSTSTDMDDRINFSNLELINDFRRSEQGVLLEIGSAKGYFLEKARAAGYSVYGLELNQKNYEYSRQRLGGTIKNVDLLDAGFEDGKFDVVYMRDVIEHIPSPKPFLQEISRIIKPGGVVFLDTHNIDGWIYQIAKDRHTVIFGFEHPVHWSPRTLGNILEQNGFLVRKVSQVSLDFTLRDILNYFLVPGFTTIYPKPVNNAMRLFVRFLLLPFRLKSVRWLDRKILPSIANFFGHGSVMKVTAQKIDQKIV